MCFDLCHQQVESLVQQAPPKDPESACILDVTWWMQDDPSHQGFLVHGVTDTPGQKA